MNNFLKPLYFKQEGAKVINHNVIVKKRNIDTLSFAISYACFFIIVYTSDRTYIQLNDDYDDAAALRGRGSKHLEGSVGCC